MPELTLYRVQHISAAPQAHDAGSLSALLEWERALAARCGRGVLLRLAVPPDVENVRRTAQRLHVIQQEHDAFLAALKRPNTVSVADWDSFRAGWAAMSVLDMNIVCEYCAEAGRDICKRIRSGRMDSAAIGARVDAICELGQVLLQSAVSDPRALLDFYQQGIFDMRRLRAAMLSAGLDVKLLDRPIAELTESRRLLKR